MLADSVSGLTMGLDGVPEWAGDSPSLTILYVDDDPDLLTIGRRFLERLGPYRVESAQSAGEALDRLRLSPVDLVLSDYQMPDMDGITFLKEVRSQYGDLPFILFTGRGREEVVIEALNSGADFYLQKGGDPRSQFVELDFTIRQAVTRRRAVQQACSLDRLYALLSRINTVSLKARTRDDLFLECCRVAVEIGKFRLAWIGRVEDDSGAVIPVALASDDLVDLDRSLGMIREEAGLLATCRCACATGTPQVCCAASQSCAGAFPLIVDGRSAGVFVVGLNGSVLFPDEEFSLLGRVASEISVALERLDRASDQARLQDALADWQLRFWLLADNSPLAYLSLDSDGRVLELNRASTELLGRAAAQVIDRPFMQFVSPNDRSHLSAFLPELRSTGSLSTYRLRLVRGNLSAVEIEITGEVSSSPDGRLLGIHCLLRPVDPATADETTLPLVDSDRS